MNTPANPFSLLSERLANGHGNAEPVLALYAFDEVVLALALIEVPCECEQGFAVRVWGGLFACWRGEGYFVAGGEELFEGFVASSIRK